MIVITGATGHVGGFVAQALGARGVETRLVVRDPARLQARGGTEVAVANYADAQALDAALGEGDRVFMCSVHASNDERVSLHTSFVEAATRNHVGHIAYLSFVGASPDAVFYHGRSHGVTERLIVDSGLPYTFVRTSMYLDNVSRWFDDDGVARGPGGSGRLSFTYRPEVASVIASVLTEGGHEGRTYDVTTRESVSITELAAQATRATGRTHTYDDQDRADWLAARATAGWAAWELEAALSSWDALRAGEFDVTTNTVAEVGGVEPISIEGFLARTASALDDGRSTL